MDGTMATKPKASQARTAKPTARSKPSRTGAARSARLEARLSEEMKALVQEAADLRGESLTEFVLLASREKAVETLREAQLIRLATADQQRFAEALLAPPVPGRHLRRAAAHYRQAMDS
jgi:uncharacterized protein (DUF1778 family)